MMCSGLQRCYCGWPAGSSLPSLSFDMLGDDDHGVDYDDVGDDGRGSNDGNGDGDDRLIG